MSLEIPHALGQKFLRDAEQFINVNLDTPEAAWPVSGPSPLAAGDTVCEAKGLTVFIDGPLHVETEVHFAQPFTGWLAELLAGQEKVCHRGRVVRCGIGGFAANAARTAHAKGAAVTLGTLLPRNRPRLLEEFLETGIRIRPGALSDGPLPHTFRLVFKDGITRYLGDAGPEREPAAFAAPRNCDVLLVGTGGPAWRRPLLSFLASFASKCPQSAIGIIGHGGWERQDWRLLQGSGCHVFLGGRELEAGFSAPKADPIHLMTRLRTLACEYNVTATRGAEGAMILNGSTYLLQVSAAKVQPRRLSGARATYAATAMLGRALGHRCGHAARLAAMDAARWVAGQWPASSLAVLEQEAGRHPELVEYVFPFPGEAE